MFLHTLWISFCFFVKWILLMYSYVYIDYWTSFLSSVNISRLRSDKRDWKLHKDVMKWTSCWFLSCNLVIKCQLFFDIFIILPDILVDVYSENGAVLMWGFSVSLRLQSVCVLASGSLKRQRIRQSAPGTGGEIIRAVLRWDFCEVSKLREKYYCEIKRYLLLLTRPDLRAQ